MGLIELFTYVHDQYDRGQKGVFICTMSSFTETIPLGLRMALTSITLSYEVVIVKPFLNSGCSLACCLATRYPKQS